MNLFFTYSTENHLLENDNVLSKLDSINLNEIKFLYKKTKDSINFIKYLYISDNNEKKRLFMKIITNPEIEKIIQNQITPTIILTIFSNSTTNLTKILKTFIEYRDILRLLHIYKKNELVNSDLILKNLFSTNVNDMMIKLDILNQLNKLMLDPKKSFLMQSLVIKYLNVLCLSKQLISNAGFIKNYLMENLNKKILIVPNNSLINLKNNENNFQDNFSKTDRVFSKPYKKNNVILKCSGKKLKKILNIDVLKLSQSQISTNDDICNYEDSPKIKVIDTFVLSSQSSVFSFSKKNNIESIQSSNENFITSLINDSQKKQSKKSNHRYESVEIDFKKF